MYLYGPVDFPYFLWILQEVKNFLFQATKKRKTTVNIIKCLLHATYCAKQFTYITA
jgi:hypothetical protein